MKISVEIWQKITPTMVLKTIELELFGAPLTLVVCDEIPVGLAGVIHNEGNEKYIVYRQVTI